jgi:hypothetical protein
MKRIDAQIAAASNADADAELREFTLVRARVANGSHAWRILLGVRTTRIATLMCVTTVAGCMPTVLPPPTVPDRVLPPGVAPAQGETAIVTVSDPALVEEVTGRYEGVTDGGHGVTGFTYRTVCVTTPCVAVLPPGPHDLRFTSLADTHNSGTAIVTATSQQPTAYRFAMGHSTDPRIGWLIPFSFGSMGVVAGIALTAIGNVQGLTAEGMKTSTDVQTPGLITLGIGVVLVALGAYLWNRERGSVQDGAGVQWTPSAAGQAAATSAR